MAVTVSVDSFSSINTMEAASDWSGESPSDVTDFYVEGSGCVGFTVRGDGNNDVTDTVSLSLSGKHLRCWIMSTTLTELNYIQVILGDGSNTGYYYIAGGTQPDYPGGWVPYVLDCDRTPDAGSQPTLTAITTLGFRFNHTGTAKNTQNTWIDNIYTGDGITAYGDDGGGNFDLDDILAADVNTTNGWGIIRKIGGVFFLTGSLTLGDNSSTNDCRFADTNEVIVFEARPVDTALYGLSVVHNSTGTGTVTFGTLSGGRGISGCTFKSEGSAKFSVTVTDTDIDTVGFYGCTFFDASTVALPAYSTTRKVISCNFEQCGVITPSTCTVQYCNIISADSDGMTFSSVTHYVSDCNFIDPTDNSIQVTTSGTINFNNVVHTGTTGSGPYDVEHTTAGVLYVGNQGTSNAQYANNTGGGSTNFVNSYPIAITVKNISGTLLSGVRVAVYKTSDRTELLNEDTVAGLADDDYTGSVPVEVEVRCREASGSSNYRNYSSIQNITSDGLTMTVTMQDDPNNST